MSAYRTEVTGLIVVLNQGVKDKRRLYIMHVNIVSVTYMKPATMLHLHTDTANHEAGGLRAACL